MKRSLRQDSEHRNPKVDDHCSAPVFWCHLPVPQAIIKKTNVFIPAPPIVGRFGHPLLTLMRLHNGVSAPPESAGSCPLLQPVFMPAGLTSYLSTLW